MKIIPALFLILSAQAAFAAEVYTVDNFADKLYGKISIETPSEVFSKGWIAIYDKKTNKELIKVESDELALSLHDGKALANIKQLPYGEQSVILYDDFNFDGKKDLAIEDGQNSCYHGPSFQIYLADNDKFTLSNDFTRLAQEYCGMFEVDAGHKKIRTMTKDGCCWHQFSEFVVKNNKPQVVQIVEDDVRASPYAVTTTKTWNGKKMIGHTETVLDLTDESVKPVFSFKVPKKDRQVVLFTTNGTVLNYALLQKEGKVEFAYPSENQESKFTLTSSPTGRSVTFANKSASYSVYEDSNTLGIKVVTGGKTYDWLGANDSKKGSLEDLFKTKLDNVSTQ